MFFRTFKRHGITLKLRKMKARTDGRSQATAWAKPSFAAFYNHGETAVWLAKNVKKSDDDLAKRREQTDGN